MNRGLCCCEFWDTLISPSSAITTAPHIGRERESCCSVTIILLLSLDKRGNYYNVGFGNVLRIFKLCKTTKQ